MTSVRNAFGSIQFNNNLEGCLQRMFSNPKSLLREALQISQQRFLTSLLASSTLIGELAGESTPTVVSSPLKKGPEQSSRESSYPGGDQCQNKDQEQDLRIHKFTKLPKRPYAFCSLEQL